MQRGEWGAHFFGLQPACSARRRSRLGAPAARLRRPIRRPCAQAESGARVATLLLLLPLHLRLLQASCGTSSCASARPPFGILHCNSRRTCRRCTVFSRRPCRTARMCRSRSYPSIFFGTWMRRGCEGPHRAVNVFVCITLSPPAAGRANHAVDAGGRAAGGMPARGGRRRRASARRAKAGVAIRVCSRNRLACAEMGLTGCHQSWFAWHANLSSVRSDKGVGWESVTPQRAGLRDLRNLRGGLRLARCGSACVQGPRNRSHVAVRVAPLKTGPRDGEPTCETSGSAREICTAIGTAPAIYRTLKSACDHTAIQSSVPLAS